MSSFLRPLVVFGAGAVAGYFVSTSQAETKKDETITSLQAQVHNLYKAATERQKELISLREEVKVVELATDQLEGVEGSVDELAIITQLKAAPDSVDIDSIRDEIREEFEVQLEEVQREYNEEISGVQDQLKNALFSLSKVKGDLREARKGLAKVADLEATAEAHTALVAKYRELEERLSSVSVKADSAEASVQVDIGTLESEQESSRQIKEALSSFAAECEKLFKTQVEIIEQGKLKALESSLDTLALSVDTLAKQLKLLKEQKKAYVKKVHLERLKVTFERKVTDLELALDSKTEEYRLLSTRMLEVSGQLHDAIDEKDEIIAAMGASSHTESYKQELLRLIEQKQELDTARKDLVTLKAEKLELLATNQRLTEALDKKQLEINRLEALTRSQAEEIVNLKAENLAIKEQASQREEELLARITLQEEELVELRERVRILEEGEVDTTDVDSLRRELRSATGRIGKLERYQERLIADRDSWKQKAQQKPAAAKSSGAKKR
ncbi:MAG: hypothetical protein L7U87_04755 [Chlamydiales bacterium]|nr:hypothetical protein [Chlamydiales bacterium]